MIPEKPISILTVEDHPIFREGLSTVLSSEPDMLLVANAYRIGYEAIRNTCMHSAASRLEVELRYTHDLNLLVRDNGIGIDAAVVDKGKDGHFGLQGNAGAGRTHRGQAYSKQFCNIRNRDESRRPRRHRLPENKFASTDPIYKDKSSVWTID